MCSREIRNEPMHIHITKGPSEETGLEAGFEAGKVVGFAYCNKAFS